MSKGLERLNNKNLPCSNCKELKRLEELKNRCSEAGITIDDYFKYLIVEDTIDNYKKLKALGIIKEKEVNTYWLIHSLTLNNYNEEVCIFRMLTQEEYDLLKEVLKDE